MHYANNTWGKNDKVFQAYFTFYTLRLTLAKTALKQQHKNGAVIAGYFWRAMICITSRAFKE